MISEEILDRYLHELKFIVLKNQATGKAFALHFGFSLPNLHHDIFIDAEAEYSKQNIDIAVLGGGRITKFGNKIIFYSHSEKYGRYEDEHVLNLAPKHEVFAGHNLTFISKAGELDWRKV
jgi:hypothetical protein